MFTIHFFRSILEEVAWRGLLQERLIQCKFSDWHIYLITAFVWSTWHIPYYLFFLDSKSVMTMILSNYLMIFSWNLIFTEVYKKTRSIWPCVILHATTNAIQFVMLEDYLVLDYKTEVLLSPATGILACGLYLVSGYLIRKYRIHSNSINTVNSL
jgi:membrane protease YdiL (CAAX protease family)